MTVTASMLQRLAQQHSAMEQRLRQWAAINSGSTHRKGLDRMCEVLHAAVSELKPDEIKIRKSQPLRSLSVEGHWQEIPIGNTLVARKRLYADHRVLLCGHMDTVYAADHPFQQLTDIDANTLQGPGVTDMKGGLVILLAALQAMEASDVADQLGWDLVINADEELGSTSSNIILHNLAGQHEVGLVFEPSVTPQGVLASQRKGSASYDLIAHGKATHVGRAFAEGRNAIVALTQCALEIAALTRPDLSVTVNIGRIIGGGPVNVVPDHCACQLNIRVIDPDSMEEIDQTVNKIVSEFQEDGIHIECEGGFTRPPKPLTQATQRLLELVASCGQELNIPITWQPTGGCCDGNNLAARGLAVVDTLGARGGNIHSEQEYILLDSLVERAQLTSLVLHHIATQGFTL